MGDFIAWLMSDHTYIDLLFIGFIMTLFIIANLLEQHDDPQDGSQFLHAGNEKRGPSSGGWLSKP